MFDFKTALYKSLDLENPVVKPAPIPTDSVNNNVVATVETILPTNENDLINVKELTNMKLIDIKRTLELAGVVLPDAEPNQIVREGINHKGGIIDPSRMSDTELADTLESLEKEDIWYDADEHKNDVPDGQDYVDAQESLQACIYEAAKRLRDNQSKQS